VSPPAVVSRQPKCLNVFCLGTDGQIYHKWWWDDKCGPSASGWDTIGGHFKTTPAVTSWGPDRLDLFAIGADGKMYHKWWDHGHWGPSYAGA
jgi:hypothetical protein